jgi:hypothetical protein
MLTQRIDPDVRTFIIRCVKLTIFRVRPANHGQRQDRPITDSARVDQEIGSRLLKQEVILHTE